MPDINFTEIENEWIRNRLDSSYDEEEGQQRQKKRRGNYSTADDYDYDDSFIWDNFGDW